MYLLFNPQNNVFSQATSIYEEVDPVLKWFPYPTHYSMIADVIEAITEKKPERVEWREQHRGSMSIMEVDANGKWKSTPILEPQRFKLEVRIDGWYCDVVALSLEEALTNFMITYTVDRESAHSKP